MNIFYIFIFFINYSYALYSTIATFNPFIKQTGFCKLQGFNTISRLTSNSIPSFINGDIVCGVGISSTIFDTNKNNNYSAPLCNACLNVTIQNPFLIDNNLNQTNHKSNIFKSNFIAIVMDRCEDEICLNNVNMLDFDIYTSNITTGNPKNIEWKFIECPVGNTSLELLVCNPNTCNKQNLEVYNESTLFVNTFIDSNDYNFVTILPRNVKYPIDNIKSYNNNVLEYLTYITGLGFQLNTNISNVENIQLLLTDIKNNTIVYSLNTTLVLNTLVSLDYAGGIIIK